jgi:sulfate transport system ATP-binding protein
MQIDLSEHSGTKEGMASAYVRPHDLEVARHVPGTVSPAHSMVARLDRAIAVGPTARLELVPLDDAGVELKPSAAHQSADNAPANTENTVIEAHISTQQYRDMGLKEGDTVVVTPRRTRVFLDQAAGI